MKRMVFGLAALMLAAAPVAAQDVGTVDWNGHPVVLKSDQTWYFDCGGYPAMMSQTIRMAFCFDPSVWSRGETVGVQEFTYLSTDNTTGVTIIPDANIYPMADLHKAVPESAATNGSTTVDKINASDAPSIIIDGRTWMGTRYTLGVEGQEFAYLDYHTSGNGFGTAQVIFWTAPGDEAQSDAKAKAFLGQVISAKDR